MPSAADGIHYGPGSRSCKTEGGTRRIEEETGRNDGNAEESGPGDDEAAERDQKTVLEKNTDRGMTSSYPALPSSEPDSIYVRVRITIDGCQYNVLNCYPLVLDFYFLFPFKDRNRSCYITYLTLIWRHC
ncbi:hypothetical protein Sango_2971200 [Sesamum angolense]|uniref:Uncharacterized protein n=1 Tax=Sesamum angolense TaxID=2727404 RepID=A0AAE1T414_9LAMI|nr:hypothetical protein Sango_2971200 [Sesamum angolense]